MHGVAQKQLETCRRQRPVPPDLFPCWVQTCPQLPWAGSEERQGNRFWILLILALVICLTQPHVWRDQETWESRGFEGPIWQANKRRSACQQGASNSLCGLDSTWCSVQKGLHAQWLWLRWPSSSVWWGICKIHPPSHIPSLARRKQGPIVQEHVCRTRGLEDEFGHGGARVRLSGYFGGEEANLCFGVGGWRRGRWALAFVVMKRAGGLLAAVPVGFLPDEVLAGSSTSPTGLVGPSTEVSVPGVLDEDGVETPGVDLQVLLVDLDGGVCQQFRLAGENEELASPFSLDDAFATPDSKTLQAVALSWVTTSAMGDQELSEGWYSAVGAAEPTPPETPSRRSRRQVPAGVTNSGGVPKAKRPTTASLQACLDVVLNTLPELTNSLKQLADRQSSLETQMVQQSSVNVPSAPAKLVELEADKTVAGQGSELARAMMAQSAALTTLAAHIAGTSQDPMADLQLPGGAGTRGSAGRARLQAELAQHRGVFYDAVLRLMSRRMAPTSVAERTPPELLAAGICGTKYLERFGGYGRFRDLGMIQYQVMTAMDFMMTEDWGAVKDTIALLAVCLEQAVLDAGRFEVAQILTLQEDIPASVFTNRQLAATSRARAFAPLSDQRWVTAAIAFLKELDTISSKRNELVGAPKDAGASSSTAAPAQTPKPKAKRKAAGKGKGVFDSSGPGLSAKRLAKLSRKRVVHILVIILDYLFLGRFPTVTELGRHPNKKQEECFRRIHAFVAACGSRSEEFEVAPGRSGPELIAYLDRLERFAQRVNVSAFGYGGEETKPMRTSPAVERRRAEEHPELRPYRPLDVSRLKITGTGNWPLSSYLESDLWLAFEEPRSLLHGLELEDVAVPNFESEDRSEYLKLAQRWDELGLLRLSAFPLCEGHFCKVFNTFKSAQFDRQIGDRRIPNSREYAAGGPSRHLPNGPLLLGFVVRRGQKLLGSLTDRRDFYHQAAVSDERSRSNMTPFSFTREELCGCRALSVFDEEEKSRSKRSREEIGDLFGIERAEQITASTPLFPVLPRSFKEIT
eukprot:s1162_g20.t1